tara:strand:+ start:5002 stop:5247 length:246 start_codon:yes stop_codon:yes gene_type:complete
MNDLTDIEVAGMYFRAKVISKGEIEVYGINAMRSLHDLYISGDLFPMSVPIGCNRVEARIGCISSNAPFNCAKITFEFPSY